MPNNESSNKRLAKNSLFLSLRMVIVLAISLYSTRILLHVLGVVDYGVYNVVCGFVAMFTFLNTSMSNGIQRFYNYELGQNDTLGANRVYCTAFIIQILLSVIIVVITESFGLWYLHNKMVIPPDRTIAAEWIFQLSIFSFVFIVMQAPYSASVIAHERMDFFAVVSVIDAALKLCAVFLLSVLSGDKLIWYGAIITIISIFNFILYFAYCKHSFNEIQLTHRVDLRLFKSMLGFSGWNLFGSFSSVMQEQGINLVINFYFGPIVNAARGVASQINAGLEGFVSSITMPVRPQVVQSYASGDDRRMMNLTFSISKLSCCFLLMMAIPISLEIDYVLRLWLVETVPEYASEFTIIILLSSLISNLNAATSNIVHATGKMKNYQFWGSMVKASSVPISFFVLKVYSQPELALLVVFVCRLAGHIVGLFIVRELVSMSLRKYTLQVIKPIIIVMGSSLLLSFLIHIVMNEGFIRLVCVSFVSIVATCFSLYYLGFNESERQLSRQLVTGFLNKYKRGN